MKAIVFDRYGGPDVLRVEELARPVPAEDDVLIRVRAAEVTKGDCELRRFEFQVKWFTLPLRLAFGLTRPRKRVLGGYFAGEVEAVGSRVTKFVPGERVFGCCGLRLGAHAEFLVLPADNTIVAMPSNASFEEAAAVPLGGLNALHFMRRAKVQDGDKVLVNGAGGSIGVYAVQIAKSLGAVVTAVDSGIKEHMLREIGAERFIDYEREDFTRGDEKYDVIFSVVAARSFGRCIRALRPGGRFVMANPRLSDMLRSTLTPAAQDKRAIFAFAGEREDELRTLKEMIEARRLKPVVDGVYRFEQATAAHRRVETEQRLGPVALSPG